MSAWMPAPPPESEPAMVKSRAVRAIIATSGPATIAEIYWGVLSGSSRFWLSGYFLDRVGDVAHHGANDFLVLALRHHPDQRLGARLAHQHPAILAKLGAGAVDAGLDPRILQRRAAAEAHILQHLGQ